jgi:fatty acid desaturase
MTAAGARFERGGRAAARTVVVPSAAMSDDSEPAPTGDASKKTEPAVEAKSETKASDTKASDTKASDTRADDAPRVTIPPERNANRNGLIRIAMLIVIAVVMLANAVGWVDPDLWVPFVCIIAVMGIGTRGGPLESVGFVAIEAAVVLVLGVATFSGSRDFVWAASVGVSLVAIGKVAFMEVQRREHAAAERAIEEMEAKQRSLARADAEKKASKKE